MIIVHGMSWWSWISGWISHSKFSLCTLSCHTLYLCAISHTYVFGINNHHHIMGLSPIESLPIQTSFLPQQTHLSSLYLQLTDVIVLICQPGGGVLSFLLLIICVGEVEELCSVYISNIALLVLVLILILIWSTMSRYFE